MKIYVMKNLLLLLFAMTLVTSQLPAQTKKELKKQKNTEEYEAMKALVSSKVYIFDADWISTTSGRKLNIASGSNSIVIVQDSTKAAMQFFGQVNSIRFNENKGVEFNNVMKDYKVEFNDKKKKILVSYSVKNKSENYTISMVITKSGFAFVDVYSNVKRHVTYDGNISAIKTK